MSDLSKLLKLQGVLWDWKENNPSGLPNTGSEMGFLAQEVHKIYPDAVVQGVDGILGIKYHSLLAPMLEGIRELDTRLRELEGEKQEDENQSPTAYLIA